MSALRSLPRFAIPGSAASAHGPAYSSAPMASPLDIGLIGAGPWARMATGPVLAAGPETRVTGVWSRTAAHAAELGAQLDAPAFDDLDALFAVCDAVSIAVAPAAQPEFAVRAAEAGKTLLLEKPLGADVHGAAAVVDAVQSARVRRARHALEPLQSRVRRLRVRGDVVRTARRTRSLRVGRVPRWPVRVRLAARARRRARRRSAPARSARRGVGRDRCRAGVGRPPRRGLVDLHARVRRDRAAPRCVAAPRPKVAPKSRSSAGPGARATTAHSPTTKPGPPGCGRVSYRSPTVERIRQVSSAPCISSD